MHDYYFVGYSSGSFGLRSAIGGAFVYLQAFHCLVKLYLMIHVPGLKLFIFSHEMHSHLVAIGQVLNFKLDLLLVLGQVHLLILNLQAFHCLVKWLAQLI